MKAICQPQRWAMYTDTPAAMAMPMLPASPFTPIVKPGFFAFWTSIGMPTGW